jgi:hypothetical protein
VEGAQFVSRFGLEEVVDLIVHRLVEYNAIPTAKHINSATLIVMKVVDATWIHTQQLSKALVAF